MSNPAGGISPKVPSPNRRNAVPSVLYSTLKIWSVEVWSVKESLRAIRVHVTALICTETVASNTFTSGMSKS